MMLILVVIYVIFLPCQEALTTFGKTRTSDLLANPISLESVLSGQYLAKHMNATWMSDYELIYRDEDMNVLKFDVDANKVIVLANSTQIPILKSSFSAKMSPDLQYLLLSRDHQMVFRHSTLARYFILDLESKNAIELSPKLLQLAEWGPKGNSLIYIHGNNIFYKENVNGYELQITDDGDRQIFNGICDWVYEEEIFESNKAVWISPDNKKLAYIQFNDLNVFHMSIPVYGQAGYPQFQYPHAINLAYPKTGSINPFVKLFLVDLSNAATAGCTKVQIKPPIEFARRQHIINLVQWANKDTLVSTWLNRVQNDSIVQLCTQIRCRNLMNVNSPGGWLERKNYIFNDDGSKFIYLTSQQQKNLNDSFQHLTLVSMDTGKQTALTSGEFVVLETLFWNRDNNFVYYAANAKNAPHIKHIWSVKADENVEGDRNPICYTCNITRNGVPQTYFEASFSPNGKYIVLENAGPSIPRTDIVMIDATNSYHLTLVRNWEDNLYLKQNLSNSQQPIKKYYQIKMTSGFEAFVKLQLPPGVDESNATKYPMLIDVYGGPNSFKGEDRWDIGWNGYLATNRKYVIAQINGRGSGNRGDKLMHQIYRKMGTVEVEDQIETASKLAAFFPFIDEKRIGIWGWSYGGYIAGMALANDNSNIFKCAASVAPITDWIYYDTIYTERYMGLPFVEDNAIGYTNARLSTLYPKFVNKTYLLVHGTLDDNVHYQQSMALIRQLELNDIPFEQITYPDEDHSLANVRKHLHHSLERFFNKCFREL